MRNDEYEILERAHRAAGVHMMQKSPRADELIACLEGEIAKRDARVAELEAGPLMAPEEARAGIALQLKEIDHLRAELAAIKAQEPIGWYTEDHLDDKSATTYSWTVAERWVEKGWPVSPLYAAPVSEAKAQEPDCDRSACGDFSPGPCDNPDCSARRDRMVGAPAAKAQGVVMPQSPHWPADDSHLSDYDRGHLQGRCDMRSEVIRLNAAPVQQVSVPDGWKLVPVEPTPEMVCAAEEAHMPFGDMDIALRMAILSAPSAPAAPAEDAGLVEALEHARLFIVNGIDLGFIHMPEAGTPDPAHETLPMIDAALAAHRAKGVV